jgi:hypothetical protein
MRRQAAVAAPLLVLTLAACGEQPPTSPAATRRPAELSFQRASAGGLTLHPSGFGEHAFAAWRAKEGIADSRGNGDHSLYFQKMTTTPTFAAGVAVIRGVEGLPLSAIGLSWEHRIDGHCGAGAPRWNVGVNLPSGGTRTFFLGCAAAPKTAGSAPGWLRDSYPGVGIDIPGATIRSLAIVFDEGNDVGRGFVHLDNVTVTIGARATVFTGPMDNGQQ